MEEEDKIYSLFSDSQAGPRLGFAKEQENSRILELERRKRYIGRDSDSPKDQTASKLTMPASINVSYTPQKIKTILDKNTYIVTLFSNYYSLKDHLCKHVLDPAERWVQLEPKLDILKTRGQLLSLDCYSHYLGSSHNSSCKWCPCLDDSQCSQLVSLPEQTYISSVTSVIELRNNSHLVVSTSAGEIVFVDELGIIVICASTVLPYDYSIKTAFRENFKSSFHRPSKEEYFNKAYNKVLNKYASTGKILSRRI